MPIVVVLPVPLTPTISDDVRAWPFAAGARRVGEDRADLALDQVAQALAVALASARRPSTMRSVAATPTSAEISSSSSASSVSTSTGRIALLGRVGAAGRSRRSGRRSAASCARGPREFCRENPCVSNSITRVPARPAAGAASTRRAPSRASGGRSSTSAICVGDRQLDAGARAERERRVGRPHAFGDHLHAADDLRRATGRARARCRRDGCG